MLGITEKQKYTLNRLNAFILFNGRSPSQREWANAHEPPISESALRCRVKWLMKKGLVANNPDGYVPLAQASEDPANSTLDAFLKIKQHLDRRGQQAAAGFWDQAHEHFHTHKNVTTMRQAYHQWAKRRARREQVNRDEG